MLKALRRRLVLLNALISGAILLGMALVGLDVAQRMVSSQYDRDFSRYSMSILAAIRESGGEAGIRVQLPPEYLIYRESKTDGASVNVSTAEAANSENIKSVVIKAREIVGDEINTFWISAAPTKDVLSVFSGPLVDIKQAEDSPFPSEGEVGYYTFSGGEGLPELHSQLQPGDIQMMTTRLTSPVLASVEGTPYRINASKVSSPASEELLLVIQNRSEEMDAIGRLRLIFFGCVMGGLTLVGVASLYLSARSIQPVEKSIRQQREFVAAASHELRTPVTAISANLDVLSDAELGEFSPYLDSVRMQSKHMTRLVVDLLDIARADAGELLINNTLIDARDIAEQTTEAMRPLFEKKGIGLAFNGKSALMIGDATRLQQILAILLDNALRYTPSGSVRVNVKKSGTRVTISVADTGIGIADDEKARVFDRFYRVDKARTREDGGAGLGLSLAKQYAEQMDGSLTLSDNECGGCIFTASFKTRLKQGALQSSTAHIPHILRRPICPYNKLPRIR